MVNHCIKIGIENDTSTLKQLSKLSYSQFGMYDIISYYKLCAISHATGILANRKKSLNRGLKPKAALSHALATFVILWFQNH